MARLSADEPILRTGWLAEAPPGFRDAIVARSDELVLRAGAVAYQVGDLSGGLYGVLSGRLEVHTQATGETPTLIHIVGPGFWTGEFAALLGRPRIVSLVARSECRLLRLSRAEFQRVTETDPQGWQTVALLILRNLSTTINLLSAIRCDDPQQRTALVLMNLAREMGQPPGQVDVSQSEIGVLARMSRGSVNAALSGLEDRGLIRRIYRAVEIVDAAGLAAFAAG